MFSENSEVSSMRIMCMLALLTSIGLAFVGMNKNNPDLTGLSMLCGAFLAAAFTGKVTSKMVEKKNDKD